MYNLDFRGLRLVRSTLPILCRRKMRMYNLDFRGLRWGTIEKGTGTNGCCMRMYNLDFRGLRSIRFFRIAEFFIFMRMYNLDFRGLRSKIIYWGKILHDNGKAWECITSTSEDCDCSLLCCKSSLCWLWWECITSTSEDCDVIHFCLTLSLFVRQWECITSTSEDCDF